MATLAAYTNRQLRAQFSVSWQVLRVLVFAIGALFAFVPFVLTLTNHEFVILPTIAAVVFVTHLVLTLRTLFVAAQAQSWTSKREWELVALTGVSARDLLWARWHSVMRVVWIDHVLFALLRLGLAVGIAQVLHLDFYACFNAKLLPLCYGNSVMFTPMSPTYPLILVALLFVIGFALLEAGLLTALFVFTSELLHAVGERIKIALALAMRAALCGLVLINWSIFQIYIEPKLNEVSICRPENNCGTLTSFDHRYGNREPFPERLLEFQLSEQVRYDAQILELYLAPSYRMSLLPLGDNATLLAADMMRPLRGFWSMIQRDTIPILVGSLLYIGLIRLFMWRAVQLSVKRGMLA